MKNLKHLNASMYCLTPDGKLYSLRANRFLSGWVHGTGYHLYGYTDDNGKVVQTAAHLLVAKTYLENNNNYGYVNHIDGDKLNNSCTNLEWCTAAYNIQHAYDNNLTVGKKPKGDVPTLKGEYTECGGSLTEEDVHTVCNLISEGYRDVDISRMTGFSRKVMNILRHKKDGYWSKVTSQYTYSFPKEQRISPEKVIAICEALARGEGVLAVSREENVNRKQVGNIKNRKTFKSISAKYLW